MARKYKRYSEEFKRDALAMAYTLGWMKGVMQAL